MPKSSYEITGLNELTKKLETLELLAQSDAINIALRAGAEIVLHEAKTLAPEKTGALKRAIRIRKGRKGKGVFSILLSVGKKFFAGKTYYGAFQEFGWKAGGRLGRKSKSRKQIPGEHFLQTASEEKASEAANAITETLTRQIESEFKK